MIGDLNGDISLHLDNEIEEDSTILRYMSFSKFKDLLENGLQFTRTDVFAETDPFEGEYTEQIYGMAASFGVVLKGESITGRKSWKDHCDKIRKRVFANCWTLSKNENVALWKLYGGHNSIAIKTSIRNLKRELEFSIEKPSQHKEKTLKLLHKEIIKIKYINHRELEKNDGKIQEMICFENAEILHYKNVGYQYEGEVRIIIGSSKEHERGIVEQFGKSLFVKTRPQEFIDRIIISPSACGRFFKSVEELVEPYGMATSVKWSELKVVSE